MPRWIAIRAGAVLMLLGGLVTLLIALLMGLSFTLRAPRESGPLPAAALKIAGVGAALVFLTLGSWAVANGIGIFRRRRWARLSVVVLAAMALFFGATGFLAMLFIPLPWNAGVDPRLAVAVRRAIMGSYLVLTGLGAWWVVLFNRGPARQYFAEAKAAVRPLSISTIAWCMWGVALGMAAGVVLRAPVFLFGWAANGWIAALVLTACIAIQIYLGAGLLELSDGARVWSIVYISLWGISGVVSALAPAFRERLRAFLDLLGRVVRFETPDAASAWTAAIAGAVLAAAMVWFLVRRREAFGPK